MISYSRRIKPRRSHSPMKERVKDLGRLIVENKEVIEQRILHLMGIASIGMGVIIFAQGLPVTLKIIFGDILPVFIQLWEASNV